jgi:hypothetical protein
MVLGRWCGHLGGAGLLPAVLLSACAQTAPQACDPAAVAPAAALRAIVQFREPVSGDAPQTLQQLRAFSQACVWPVSSVSPSLHVYRFSGAADAVLLRQRLLAWPLVQDVVPDAMLRPHTAP